MPDVALEPGPIELFVSQELAGARLDQFLTALLLERSRSQIQRLIKDGRVAVDGGPGRASQHVKIGQRVLVTVPLPAPATPQPEALPIEIVYDDADVVVVDKPAGMVVHPAAGHARGTLVNALLHHVSGLSGIGGEQRPGIVHRLDRGTSGLMVVAKHDAAHTELARQFRDREVEKEYVALVWGLVHAGRRIEAPLGRDPLNRRKISTRGRRARTAVTRVTKAEHLRGVSLLHVTIATGRTHQIRVHLSSIGHPIVGDTLYGGTRRHLPAYVRPIGRLGRPFLHAARLTFTHPRDGQRLSCSSDLPRDLQEILDELRRTAMDTRH
jgi:23S rRNA pseudouridine1911/1915/1917 synthase